VTVPEVILAHDSFRLSLIDGQVDGRGAVRVGGHEIADAYRVVGY